MRCTKPTGHPGNHGTDMIPEPLAPVAAQMVREHDSLLRERALFARERDMWTRRFWWLWLVNGAVLITAIAVITHAVLFMAERA